MLKRYDILIIGAGSVGVPLAYYLALEKLRVAVLEKEASVGRGQNRAAIGGVRATHSDPAKIAICQESIRCFSSMQDKHGFDIHWKQGGYCYPAYRREEERTFKELLQIQVRYKLNISWLSVDAVIRRIPGINPEGLLGGTFSPEDGSASPLLTSDAYFQLARQSGAEFYFGEEVHEMRTRGKRIEEVRTNKGTYSAGLIINCAGAHAANIARLSGQDFPVNPDSHEAGISEPVRSLFDPMIVDMRPEKDSKNYYFYQNKEGQIVFCITPHPARTGFDCDNTSEFLPLVVRRMIGIYPRLRSLRVRRTWRGLYPMTPDGFPLIGYNRELENNFLAIGMCGQGFMLGPGLGKILAVHLTSGKSDYDFILKQLNPYRSFDSQEALQ
ncbi:MAG: FAD-binding oxidoreductase [Candidatus Neomarinimicrobiota bacterium]|nr:FAD-binding oxidoreductase [Candidatus Neomarinimicrobiota bacterium]MDX9779942.1 FAD-binding oxidoreductase [bacterium]